MKSLFISFTLFLSNICFAADKPDMATFQKEIKPLLEKYCLDCHDEDVQKGNVSLAGISIDMVDDKSSILWTKVYDQLVLSEMPPKKKSQPGFNERTMAIKWIESELTKSGKKPVNPLFIPGNGNYIDHDLLFGSKRFGASYTPARVWRIRPEIYAKRSKKLVSHVSLLKPFNMKAGGHGFKDYDNLYRLSGPDLNQMMANAKTISVALTSTRMKNGKINRGNATPDFIFKKIHPEGQTFDDTFLTEVANWMYSKTLLRKPTDEELTKLLAFCKKSIASDGQLLGLRNLISAVLLKGESYFRSEKGYGKKDKDGRRKLSGREIAFAISYALTNSPPNEKLLQLAESGKLNDLVTLQKQIKSMLDDDKLEKPRILKFFREYFEYDGALSVFKDAGLNKEHDPEVLVNDTDHLIKYILKQDKDVFKELLTTNKVFVNYKIHNKKIVKATNKNIHTSYNLPADWKWTPNQPVELPNEIRSGILTQPSWLVAKSDNFNNHAIHRGIWIRYKLLGGKFPDVPITVDAQLPNDETLTLRQKMEVTREKYCWRCHQNMDQLGLPFEQFEHFGRFRVMDLKKAVNTKGSIDFSGEKSLDGEVENPFEMIQKMADSTRVRQVFIRHAFRYWMGRNEMLTDADTLRRLDKIYLKSGGSMKALIVGLLSSDAFLYRKES